MKSQLLLLFLIVSCFLNTKLSGQTVNVDVGCKPLSVKFTAPSGSSSFFWDFKDGVTSTVENPVNSFTKAGVFLVEFKETKDGPIVGTVSINVLESLDLKIEAIPTSGCVGQTIILEDKTQYPDEITDVTNLWAFGDGKTANGKKVNHVFTSAGTFTISLDVKTNLENCDITKPFTDFISIQASPNPIFITDPLSTISCDPPIDISFENKTPSLNSNSYEWDMGNNQTYDSINPEDQSYDEGTYVVKLTATSANGCSASITKTVISGPPQASFSVQDTACVRTQVDFVNKTIGNGSFTWDFGATAIPPSSTDINVSVKFTTGGIHPVKLTVVSGDGGCSSDTIINIFVESPDASFVSDPTFSCKRLSEFSFSAIPKEGNSYYWIFGNGDTSRLVNPTVIIDQSDTSEYVEHKLLELYTTLFVLSPTGCLDSFSKIDTIFRPYAHFEPDTTKGCAPLEVNFSDLSLSLSSINSWSYDFGDGESQINTTSDEFAHTFTDPGTYDVFLQIENEKGCRDTSFHATIFVGDMQNVSFTAEPTNICIGDTVLFEGHSMDPDPTEWHFETDNGRSTHCYPDSVMKWVFNTEPGVFDVELWAEYNGCFTVNTVPNMITVEGPLAKIDYLVDCTTPNDISFRDSSKAATTITWYFGDGDSSLVNNIVHHYDVEGDYQVILKAESASGCAPNYDTTLVCVRNLQAGINLDRLICRGNPYELDATNSVGVDNRCHRGYTWFFQENSRPITTSMDIKENFIFGVKGIDTIGLEVRDINGCLDTAYHVVDVFESQPDFTMDKSKICFPSDVTFQTNSTADTTIIKSEWDFGDNQTLIDLANSNPTHTYGTGSPNSIVVTLTITDIIGCDAQVSHEIEIYEPISVMIPNSKVVCENSSVAFASTDYTAQGSNLTYEWSTNGQTSTEQSPTFIYGSEGEYPVSLVFTEVSTGCQGERIGNISVQGYPEAEITLVNSENFCAPKILSFKDGSESNFLLSSIWDFGNGSFGTGPSVTATYPRGNYDVKLVVSTSAGCIDSVTVPITVVGPEGNFEVDKDSICVDETITFNLIDTLDFGAYQWEFGDGNIKKNNDPVSHMYSEYPLGGQTVVKLIFSDLAGGCTSFAEKSIFIRDVMADFERGLGDLSGRICLGDNIKFNSLSTGANVFSWDFGDGMTSNLEHPPYGYQEPGIYDITLSVENSQFGCTDVVEKTVVVDPLPKLSAIGDTICVGFSAMLNVLNPNANYTYKWTSNDVGFIVDDMAVGETVVLNTEGTFHAQIEATENDTGCTDFMEVDIVVIAGIPIVTKDSVIFVEDNVIINGDGGSYDFEWNQVDTAGVKVNLSCTNCPSPEFVVPKGASSLVFEATVSGGSCDSVIWRFTYEVIDVENPRYPKVFTPNSDGKNDYFFPIFNNDETKAYAVITDLQIFNRWGGKIYDNDNPGQGWDGTVNGKPASQDVYLYIAKGHFPGKEDQPFTNHGDITLLR